VKIESTLWDAPLHAALELAPGPLPQEVSRRLVAFGLRPGVTFWALGRTSGGGRVIRVDQTRVALGSQLCKDLMVRTAA